MRTFALGLLLALLVVAGCGTPNPADSGVDVAHASDATDVATHTDVPVATDTPDAATPDVATDAPADVAVDASQDAAVDAPADVATTDAPCTRPGTATDSIGAACTAGSDTCPAGYTCQLHEGIIATSSCEITCHTDCECPPSLSCMTETDKAGSHGECH